MSPSSINSQVFLNYFVCTLGEAAGQNISRPGLTTINDFIDHQADNYPGDFAVGFPCPTDKKNEWKYELFTFANLRDGSWAVAEEFEIPDPHVSESTKTRSVALLCPSSLDFLFAWLGLMRAGYSVLLIAPQCQPAAIAHLCQVCNVSTLIHHTSFEDLAIKASSLAPESTLKGVPLPWAGKRQWLVNTARKPQSRSSSRSRRQLDALETAFFFHTSGTSTGLPKPIPQSHHAAFGVLPVYDGRESATFTTTPLYHGGIADCFRAWTSRALIWLFPAADVPITTQNILSSLSVAKIACPEESPSSVKYFSSVPYILQMLLEESSGLTMLQTMDIVGVGGAALSQSIGDDLVRNGINLVSRFGSAECGFLLSSHRDYNHDKAWDYLRLRPESKHLLFEKRIENDTTLWELIIENGWPHIAKVNREDGGYTTSDLFEPHPTIDGAWKYHSRGDSQITLTTGKKFDPAPLEDLIASKSPSIREVVIFGSGRDVPGLLVFPADKVVDIADFENLVWEVVKEVNSQGQDHTRISRNMVVSMPFDSPRIERSSKGTLLRGATEKTFVKEISEAYEEDASLYCKPLDISASLNDVQDLVQSSVRETLGDESLNEQDDFYSHGVDSMSATRIRSILQRHLKPNQICMPWNVVYECGNIVELSRYVHATLRRRPEAIGVHKQDDEMLGLVDQFTLCKSTVPSENKRQIPNNTKLVIVLTGATGALGAQILDLLRADLFVSRIFCLVRAVDHYTARSRVSASLAKRGKSQLNIEDPKVWCSPCKLSDSTLGLSEIERSHLSETATHIIHAAWAVNFSLPLKSFVTDHITGLNHLLGFTASCANAVQFNFCSSTASVLGPSHPSVIPEKFSKDSSDSGPLGYARSKWVAEAICAASAKNLQGNVNVLRIGQLTGDTQHGIWNVSEAWPLMLMSVDALGSLPTLTQPLNWLPMDLAAKAVIEIALQAPRPDTEARVFHVVNNSTTSTWTDLLRWVGDIRTTPFDVLPISAWLDKLDSFQGRLPAKNLSQLWREAFTSKEESPEHDAKPVTTTTFSTTNAENVSSVMKAVPPVDDRLAKKIWSWLEKEIQAAKVQVYVSRNRFDNL